VKVGVVVARYGDEVSGELEDHCRSVASRLARAHDLEVLTTCAPEAATWSNEYRAGPAQVGGVRVRRFPVARRRSPAREEACRSGLRDPSHTDAHERWIEEPGPVAPALVRYLDRHAREYDALLFFGADSWTTLDALPVAPRRSVLVPFTSEEVSIETRRLRDVLRLPAALAFTSPEERRDLVAVLGGADLPGDIVGLGVDLGAEAAPVGRARRLEVLGLYIIYMGRSAREAGCSRLLMEFARYVQEQAPNLSLVLAGKAVLPIPVHANLTHLGVLTAAERRELLARSLLLVQPSMRARACSSILEAWAAGRPVLVNARCGDVAAEVVRAGGGLGYASYEEFAEALAFLRARPGLADAMGRSGRAYAEANHAWPVVMERYERLLLRVARLAA
jgi:glycosyltransferase involved in cell wall biosynthesis